jgi:hypothetical protein
MTQRRRRAAASSSTSSQRSWVTLKFDTLRITWKRLKRKPVPLARQLRAILAARDPARRS